MPGMLSGFEARLAERAVGGLAHEAVKLACGIIAPAEATASDVTPPTFRGAALAAQDIEAHEWMLAGPAETGKTFAALWRLDSLLRTTRHARAAIVRKVRADMDSTVLATWRRIIEMRGGVEVFGGNHPEWYDYPNGSRVTVAGMDRPGKVLSGELDFIFANQAEELELGDWETLSTRCTGRGSVVATPMLFGDCNPGPPTHWILARPSLRVLHSRHEDNPTLYGEAGELTEQGARSLAVLDALTGVRRERLRFGRWVAAEGVVYEDWTQDHVVDPFEIPAHWRRIISIDFGYTNPFVCGWWAIDPDGRMYLYRQIYMSQRTIDEHAEAMLRYSVGERYEARAADHDAGERATLAGYGLSTVPAYKAVSAGIQAVQERLKPAGDGKPRLFIVRDSLVERDESLAAAHKPVCTEQEFPVYAWQKSSDGRPNKEEPMKVDDHGMDMVRYAVAYVDQLRGRRGEVRSYQG